MTRHMEFHPQRKSKERTAVKTGGSETERKERERDRHTMTDLNNLC